MPKKTIKKKKHTYRPNTNNGTSGTAKESEPHNSVLLTILIRAIVPIAVAWITSRAYYNTLNSKIDDIKTDIRQIITDVQSDQRTLDQLLLRIERTEDDIRSLRENMDTVLRYTFPRDAISLNPSGVLFDSISQFDTSDKNDAHLENLSFQNTDIIIATGTDFKEYSAQSLQNQSFIFSYKENDQDVFFYGGFDSNNRWDGICLVNVYHDGKLVIATESLYDGGEQIRYTQVFPYGDVWFYGERKNEEASNPGATWTYKKTNECTQEIDESDPDERLLVRPAQFIRSLGNPLSVYHGKTLDGKYNDETSDAYLIAYSADGKIRTLYHGRFRNGQFYDTTKEAWYITRDPDKNTNYMYYKGVFRDGHPSEKKSEQVEVVNPATVELIERVINSVKIEEQLPWSMESIAE